MLLYENYIKKGIENMKKLLPLCIVGILVLSGLGVVARTNDKTNDLKTKTESIAISEPVIKDEGRYVTVSLGEAASSLFDSGKPMLPVLTKVFTFPFETKIRSVNVSFSETNELTLSKEVHPATKPNPVDAKVANEPITDPAVYESSELYPARSYRYTTGAGLDSKEHVIYLAVQCYPVRYSAAQNIIYYSENAKIQVTYEEPVTPTVFSDQYDLVIITPSEFSNELQPLIDHKISMGVHTNLKTTEDIYSEYNGFDQAEKIKYFIKDAIETWGIDYVLLVGSIDKVPIRTSYASFWEGGLLTDLYYADIYNDTSGFCSWDKDGDGKYGEVYHDQHQIYNIDGADLYPDVNVGRLPCGTNAEVKTVVHKIIHYETETYGKSWFKNIILIGGDTFPGDGGNEGEEQNQITEQIMSDFTPIQLWTSDGTFNARSLNQAINNGAGFIDYSGHGFEIGVATHPPNSDTWVPYHTNHLLGAKNGYKLPIIFFDACLTAKLDFNFSELIGYASVNLQLFVNKFRTIASRLFPTFAWCMVKKSNGGAIATIGATRTAFGGIDFGCGYLAIHFWQAYSTSETVSQMMTKAQNDYITNISDDFITVEEFILIGDPSLKIGGY
jgi:hypothetical protein